MENVFGELCVFDLIDTAHACKIFAYPVNIIINGAFFFLLLLLLFFFE